MFGFVADILTTSTSVLFPVYASYKALTTSDPALLSPWLIYWTTLSLSLSIESLFSPILSYLPFYAWLRLCWHLYLVLPGQQGSVYMYRAYIHPFLESHERAIDDAISDGHAKLKAAGSDYLRQALEWARVHVLGLQPRRPSPPPTRQGSYASALLARFNMPSARDAGAGQEGAAAAAAAAANTTAGGAADLLGLLGQALNQAAVYSGSGRAREGTAAAASASSSSALVPPNLHGEDKAAFIATQRSRLQMLLRAFDSAAAAGVEPGSPELGDRGGQDTPSSSPSLSAGAGEWSRASGEMRKSRSEAEFEDLAYEDVPAAAAAAAAEGQGQRKNVLAAQRERRMGERQPSWSKWIWGNYGEKDSAAERGTEKAGEDKTGQDKTVVEEEEEKKEQ